MNKGIMLDLGCGGNKQRGFVGIDKRPVDGVDIVHDLEVFPYPLEDNACLTIVGSHIIEHIKPWLMIDLMDELWRITVPDGQVALSMPYGVSHGFIQDPTHCNPCNEATWQYFDPRYPLFQIYQPKPWEIQKGFPAWQENGNLEVLLRKIGLQCSKCGFYHTKDETCREAESYVPLPGFIPDKKGTYIKPVGGDCRHEWIPFVGEI